MPFGASRAGLMSVAADDIPDSENLHAHYDLQQQPESDSETIDVLVDQSGNENDADAVGSPTMDIDGYNGKPTAVLDGIGDGFDVEPADFDTISQPLTWYFVLDYQDDESDRTRLSDNRRDGESVQLQWEGGEGWRASVNSLFPIIGDLFDSETDWLTVVFDGADSHIESQSESDTGSIDSEDVDMNAFPIAHRNDSGSTDGFIELNISEILVYDAGHDTETRDGVIDYIENRWGI